MLERRPDYVWIEDEGAGRTNSRLVQQRVPGDFFRVASYNLEGRCKGEYERAGFRIVNALGEK